jgi:predicted dehydrogenase
MNNKPLKLIVVGAGKMGKAHATAFAGIPNVEIVGIASRGGSSAKALAKSIGVEKSSTDWKALAKDEGADACVISVSHMLNPVITREAIEMDLHVLSEKPVAFKSQTALELAEMAEERKLVNLAAVNRRFFPSVLAALQISEIHRPVYGITCYASDPVSPYRITGKFDPFVYNNWMLFQTIHVLDTLKFLGGPVGDISGAKKNNSETDIFAHLEFTSGVIGTLIATSSSRKRWEITIHCDGFELQLSPLNTLKMVFPNGSQKAITTPIIQNCPRPDLAFQAKLFANAIQDSRDDFYPASNFRNHSETLQLVEAINKLRPTFPSPPANFSDQ